MRNIPGGSAPPKAQLCSSLAVPAGRCHHHHPWNMCHVEWDCALQECLLLCQEITEGHRAGGDLLTSVAPVPSPGLNSKQTLSQ